MTARPLDEHDERAARGWGQALAHGASAPRVLSLIRWWVEKFTDEQRARGFRQ